MLAIFVATMIGLILQPLPTPAVSLIGLAAAMITGAMDIGAGEALSGFHAFVNTITSAMFVTAMAGNPVAQTAANDLFATMGLDIEVT